MLTRSLMSNVTRFAQKTKFSTPQKLYASLHTDVTPTGLHWSPQFPSENKTAGAIVILHGLFGSSRNWSSHSRAFARNLRRPVYAVDLRNHGASSHAEPMTYTAMATDIIHFIQKNSLTDVCLIGHSMGGKVAMTVALENSLPPETLSKLIVVDIAPAIGDISTEFQGYITAMKKIEAAKVSSRKEALNILQQYEKDPDVCAFLLHNLIEKPKASRFRVAVDLIGNYIHEMGSFPFAPEEAQWQGETLFIKGANSNYINRQNLPLAEKFFPNVKIETLDTNHWVHSERPHEFGALVENFVQPLP